MVNSGSTLSSSSSNKWHSTATHTSSSITATHGYRHRPSIPLSDISTNINAAAAAMTTVSTKCIYVKEGKIKFLKNLEKIFSFFFQLLVLIIVQHIYH
jgi:hypothetical protein